MKNSQLSNNKFVTTDSPLIYQLFISKLRFFALVLMILSIHILPMSAQEFTDTASESPELPSEKSAAKAMIYSAIFPGAGQYYVSKKSVWTYVFPAVEIGLFVAANHFDKKGDRLTRKFEKFADAHYDRDHYEIVKNNFIASATHPMYDENYFRLGDKVTDKQHYYEDIGKYHKYIFGWDDWFMNNADSEGNVNWLWDDDRFWIGSVHKNGDREVPPYSALRAEYFKMRDEANETYYLRQNMYYLIVLNHGLSVFQANRAAKSHNKKLLIQPNYTIYRINDSLIPVVCLTAKF
ncbi:MAG: hypothetical protein FWG20_02955 [Candidatus Cloacimonetes bacterium]|nr:hypothetical protein [Candidatus Cloacimonadota bacterium]